MIITSRKLTPRETQLVDLMLDGAKPREISSKLGLTHSTVNTYRKRIFAKLEVHSQIELVAKVHAERGAALVEQLMVELAVHTGEHVLVPRALALEIVEALGGVP